MVCGMRRGGGGKGMHCLQHSNHMALKELTYVNREHYGFYLIIDQYNIVNFL